MPISLSCAARKNLMAPELAAARPGPLVPPRHPLQCAGGRGTLSLWNQGAAEVVGVDISDRMIACARRKAEALGAPAAWHCCDVLATPPNSTARQPGLHRARGAVWVMEIRAWAAVVARLLKPGGHLYVFEGHPLGWLWDQAQSELALDLNPPFGDYFAEEVSSDQGWPVEYIPSLDVPTGQQAFKHERQWTLGSIVTALAEAGLRLEALEEHSLQYWDAYPHWPQELADRLPNTFSLWMRKEPA